MDSFIQTLRNAFFGGGENKTTPENVTAKSGDNIRFQEGVRVSDNFTKALGDIVSFYQKEFKVTPNATIQYGKDKLPSGVSGSTFTMQDREGRVPVTLRNLAREDEEREKASNIESVSLNFSPKGSDDIGSTSVHELGHALYSTLFPAKDTSSNASQKYNDLGEKLVKEALKDIGTKNDDEEATIEDISGYALAGPAETIAEGLTDYYYNRKNAAPLSQAIVKRLKSQGSLYGLKQQGAVDTSSSADNFIKNLRRYSVIK